MSGYNDRARPLAWDGLEVESSRRLNDSNSLPAGWPWHEDVDPLRLSGRERACHWTGWSRGYYEGFTRGCRAGWRARVETEYRAWEPMARSIRAAGGPFSLSYAELERRRRQLPDGYVPRNVPTFDECMASWEAA